jgi:4-hydroxybenzoate polyprenyltransferase
MINTAFFLIFRKLRLSQPWNYKAPALVAIPYFFLYASRASLSAALLAVGCSLATGIGVAGLGYFINDLADRQTDLLAGAPNGAQGLSHWQITLVAVFFLAAFILPWLFYFPVNPLIFCLLAAQVLLYLAYSAPPLRLKDRGFTGIIADALYAHANPALIGAYTFYLLTNRTFDHFYLFLWSLVGWQFFYGLRSILQHQLDDVHNDRAAGSKTYVATAGVKTASRRMKNVLLPLEGMAFLFYTWVVSLTFPALFVLWPLYVFITAMTQPRLSLYLFTDTYYLRWQPLVFLFYLCFRDPGMSLLLIAHLALFNNGLSPIFKLWIPRKKEKRTF